jgi:hypothetical protein
MIFYEDCYYFNFGPNLAALGVIGEYAEIFQKLMMILEGKYFKKYRFL